MLVLGIVAFIAGILLVTADALARRSRHREEQASLQRDNQGLAARLAAVEAQFPQALVMMDARGLIRRINPAAEDLFGYAEEELLGHNILRLLPFAPSARNPAASRIAPDSEMAVRRKDGTMVQVRLTGIRSESEGQSDFYMFFEPALAAMPASAPAPPPLALVERVVGRISGKFEVLLTAINGYGELALHAASEDSPLRPHLEEIVTASEQASYLARNLLAFSGNQLIPVEPVDLNAAALAAVHEIQEGVNLNLAAQAPVAVANRECLQQVIRLLVESAGYRRSAPTSPIRVHTSQRVLDGALRVYSGELPAGIYCTISVSDSGMPLDAEVLAHMFEPLYLNPTLLGVDLSPIYGIVSSLGGRLHVESGDARGTSVEIWLPAAVEQMGAHGSQSRGAVANG